MGKGFAVVASEVKNLANQTAKATEEISSKIATVQGGVQGGTTDAVQAIGSITKVITEMSAISSSVASAVQEQTAATGEIARNVEQAALGTQEVSRNIGEVEAASREAGRAAEQTNEAATELAHQGDVLKQETLLQRGGDCGWRGGIVGEASLTFPCSDPADAVQSQRRAPSSHPQAAIQGSQLAGV